MTNATLPAHVVLSGFLGLLGVLICATSTGHPWPAWLGILTIIAAAAVYVRHALARDMEQIIMREIGALDLRVRMASGGVVSVPRQRERHLSSLDN